MPTLHQCFDNIANADACPAYTPATIPTVHLSYRCLAKAVLELDLRCNAEVIMSSQTSYTPCVCCISTRAGGRRGGGEGGGVELFLHVHAPLVSFAGEDDRAWKLWQVPQFAKRLNPPGGGGGGVGGGGGTKGGMWRVRSSASTCVSLSSLMKVSAQVWLVWMVMCM